MEFSLGNEWNSVAIDESHEMFINRDLKDAIARPGINSINQVALSFLYKSSNLGNIRNEVFNKELMTNNISSTDHKINDDVIAILNGIKESSLLPTSNSDPPSLTLRNSFTEVTATSEQEHDLLHFRSIGQDDLENHIKQTYLKAKK